MIINRKLLLNLITAFTTILFSALIPVSVAHAESTKNISIEPVGYNIINGHLDTKNPIENPNLMEDPGYSRTDSNPGSLPDSDIATEEKIIKEDNRALITNTTDTPYRWLGMIDYTTSANNEGICTGALISKDTVLTAGHCVARGNRNFTFTPGRNGNNRPFGTIQVTQVWYDKNFDYINNDWGILKLATPIGDKIGWFGMHVANKTTLFNQYATIAGYPSDKPENTLWKDKSTIIKMTDKQVYYNTDTYRGQSGAPVLDDKASIYAIHTNGNSQHNWGTLLTNELFSVVANISHMTQSSED